MVNKWEHIYACIKKELISKKNKSSEVFVVSINFHLICNT